MMHSIHLLVDNFFTCASSFANTGCHITTTKHAVLCEVLLVKKRHWALMVMNRLSFCGRRVTTNQSVFTPHWNFKTFNLHFNHQHTRGCISFLMLVARPHTHHLVLRTSPETLLHDPRQRIHHLQTMTNNINTIMATTKSMLIPTYQYTLHLILLLLNLLNLIILVSLHQLHQSNLHRQLIPPPLGWGVKLVQNLHLFKNPYSKITAQEPNQHHQLTETFQFNHHQDLHRTQSMRDLGLQPEEDQEEVMNHLMRKWTNEWKREE